MGKCVGVGKRRCGKETDSRSPRCCECRAVHEKLKKREHNHNYRLDHGDRLNEKRREDRKRAKVIGLLRELSEAGGIPPAQPTANSQTKKAKRGRPRLTDEEKLDSKKRLAAGLIVRVRVEGKQPHEAWFLTHPRSKANRRTATREANRLMKWYRKEFPIDMETLFYLHGIDYDTFCQSIKELLAATRYYRGEPTDLADWDARRRGMKILMIGLGLATPIGFRSGPRAVGGALENERIDMNGAGETGVHDPEGDLVRKYRAEAIIFRHYKERKRLSEIWAELCPSSDANPRSAAKKARADLTWYAARRFQSFEQRLVANGLDNHTVVEGIKEMLGARKARRGVLTDEPDWPVRTKGRDLLMVLHGFRHPRGKRGRTPRVVSVLDVAWPASRKAV